MSIKYKVEEGGLRVTTSSNTGTETTVIIGYEKAMEVKTAGKAITNAVKASGSVRQAALTLIHTIQKTGMIGPWLNGGSVTRELLAKMKEAEDSVGKDFGLTSEDWAVLRQPGQYADTRSQAIKAWSYGQPLEVGTDDKGVAILLTTNGLRKINAAHRKAPEAKGIDDILETLEQYLKENPQEAADATPRIMKIMSEARALLDAAQKRMDTPDAGAEEVRVANLAKESVEA